VDVQAPAAARPDEAGQAEFAVQQVTRPQRGPPDVGEPFGVGGSKSNTIWSGASSLSTRLRNAWISMQA
jgi:hypothetical protein